MKTNINLRTDHGEYRISINDKVEDGAGIRYFQLDGIAPEQVNRLSQIAMLSSLLLSLIEGSPAAAKSEEKAGRLPEYQTKVPIASSDFYGKAGSDSCHIQPWPVPEEHPLDNRLKMAAPEPEEHPLNDNEWMELYELKNERESLVRLLERYGQNPDDMILAKVAWLIKNQSSPSEPVPEEHLFDGLDSEPEVQILPGLLAELLKDNMRLAMLFARYNFHGGSIYARVELLLQKEAKRFASTEDNEGDGRNESS